jgi:hypothetical protein
MYQMYSRVQDDASTFDVSINRIHFGVYETLSLLGTIPCSMQDSLNIQESYSNGPVLEI